MGYYSDLVAFGGRRGCIASWRDVMSARYFWSSFVYGPCSALNQERACPFGLGMPKVRSDRTVGCNATYLSSAGRVPESPMNRGPQVENAPTVQGQGQGLKAGPARQILQADLALQANFRVVKVWRKNEAMGDRTRGAFLVERAPCFLMMSFRARIGQDTAQRLFATSPPQRTMRPKTKKKAGK